MPRKRGNDAIVFLFIAVAYASWRGGSHLAYMMAWFIGASNLAYIIGNGLAKFGIYGH
jgi:hypothetical protein